jgi:hypothetical protein
MNMNFIAFDSVSSFSPSGTYNLQLNPEKFEIGYPKKKDDNCTQSSADGQMVESSEPLFSLKTWSVTFTIDNTGAVPFPPSASPFPITTPGNSIYPSISYFNELFVEPDNEIHSRKYIKGIWGMGDLTIFGKVKEFKYEYTFFTNSGTPLRANCTVFIEEVPIPSMGSLFMSPDITRIPKVKQSDNIIDFCQKYYDDKNYYLQVAEHNNLPSFRKLKTGTNLEFPPIKK